MQSAIRVENVSKRYRLGARATGYQTLRDTIMEGVSAPWRQLRRWVGRNSQGPIDPCGDGSAGSLWALDDVSFEVQPGEVVGIIGANGAGKSTLLKVLSRIVEPTTGRVEIRGRVGSLLEVGTGFHQELTGRENIYLNGAILGMTRREITCKFDEIVAFAEIGKFLDTPVKRYSSGMYVRLAFGVAAHLEPEILLVDEVLAVGDSAFQRRCIQKMNDIGRSGRTILFISHNLGAVLALCKNAITLQQGRLVAAGPTELQVSQYLGGLIERSQIPVGERTDREGSGLVRITRLGFADGQGQPVGHTFSGSPLDVVVRYEASHVGSKALIVGLSFWSLEGQKIFSVDNRMRGVILPAPLASGEYVCTFPKLPLPPGKYYVNVIVYVNHEVVDHVPSAGLIEVLPGDFFACGKPTPAGGGFVYVDHEWS